MVDQVAPPAKDKKVASKGKSPKLVLLYVFTIIILATGLAILNRGDEDEVPKFGTQKTACQILNKDTAQRVLSVAKQDNSTELHKASTEDNRITHCTYVSTSKDLPKDSYYAASLTVYAPKTIEGVNINKQLFEKADNKPGVMFATTNGSIQQFWNSTEGELELLKGSSRYTIVVGSKKASDRNYARALELAELLKKQF